MKNTEIKCKTCEGCEHLKNPQGGYCYMFKEKPENCQLNTCPDKDERAGCCWYSTVLKGVAENLEVDEFVHVVNSTFIAMYPGKGVLRRLEFEPETRDFTKIFIEGGR